MLYKELFNAEDTESPGERLSIRVLHVFGESPEGYLDPDKIRDLWMAMKDHDVLFTDYTYGKLEPFIDILFDKRSIWLEIYSEVDQMPIGVMMASKIIPHFDANGHFAIWKGRPRGKEKALLKAILWLFDEFDLHRMTAEIAGYQKGVIRFTQRLGFKLEGEKREAVIKKGEWRGLVMLGLTRDELQEALNG